MSQKICYTLVIYYKCDRLCMLSLYPTVTTDILSAWPRVTFNGNIPNNSFVNDSPDLYTYHVVVPRCICMWLRYGSPVFELISKMVSFFVLEGTPQLGTWYLFLSCGINMIRAPCVLCTVHTSYTLTISHINLSCFVQKPLSGTN